MVLAKNQKTTQNVFIIFSNRKDKKNFKLEENSKKTKLKIIRNKIMVEPLLSGIVLGLVPVTLIGLFVTAYLQYRRGDRITNF